GGNVYHRCNSYQQAQYRGRGDVELCFVIKEHNLLYCSRQTDMYRCIVRSVCSGGKVCPGFVPPHTLSPSWMLRYTTEERHHRLAEQRWQCSVRCMSSAAKRKRSLHSAFPVLEQPLQPIQQHVYEANLQNSNACHKKSVLLSLALIHLVNFPHCIIN
ncbi:hypothetical protein F7725_028008, partial [Dissostichus mawsoni]